MKREEEISIIIEMWKILNFRLRNIEDLNEIFNGPLALSFFVLRILFPFSR